MTVSTKFKLVFVNGWGFTKDNWFSFFERFDCFESCELIDLDQSYSIDQWCELIRSRVDSDTVLIGWSLGGMLSALSVEAFAARPRALICLMSNIRFEQCANWEFGVDPQSFQALSRLLDLSSKKALSRFAAMAVQGSEYARTDLRALKPSNFSYEALASGLACLRKIDLRSSAFGASSQFWLFGNEDQLVPKPEQIIRAFPEGVSFEVLGGVAHLPMFSAADMAASSINKFLSGLVEDGKVA